MIASVGGIPLGLVDAVHDPDEALAQADERVVQPEAARGRAQLVRVRRAHRRHAVRERHAALEQVHPAVPLELREVVQLPRQPEFGQRFLGEVALESRVMHRKDAGRASIKLAVGIGVVGAQVDRRQRRVPVVRVQQHGRRRNLRQDVQRREAEEREAPMVVLVVATAVAVDLFAVEILRVVDEQNPRLPLPRIVHQRARFVDPSHFMPRSYNHREGIADRLQVRRHLDHLLVQRHHDDRLDAGPRLIMRQARHRLAEPSGPRERCQLRGQVHDGDRLVVRSRRERIRTRSRGHGPRRDRDGRGWRNGWRRAPATAFHVALVRQSVDRPERHCRAWPARSAARRTPSPCDAR